MTETKPEDLRTLDQAIEECSNYILDNRNSSRGTLRVVGSLLLILTVLLGIFIVIQFKYESLFHSPLITTIVSGFFILGSIIIFVYLSFHRFHLLEIARIEHYKIGFLRIRVAGNNSSQGFQSEVRKALTNGVFTYEPVKSTKGAKMENPLPGHPTSEIYTALVNKLLDSIDIVLKQKQQNSGKEEK